jgi:hypothetical protein
VAAEGVPWGSQEKEALSFKGEDEGAKLRMASKLVIG